MTNKPKASAMQNEVMRKIHSGSVRMKPRAYFTILWLLGILASIAASVTFAYIINMLIYSVRIQTANTPAYGARQNLSEALASFPWWAVAAAVTLSVVAVVLLRKYSRIYRYKVRTIITAFLLISVLLGLILSSANIGHAKKENMQQRQNNNGTHLQDGSGRGSGKNNN